MAFATLDQLIHDEGLLSMAARLSQRTPGLVVTTGQTGSGRLTTLVALAHVVAKSDGPVMVLSDRTDAFHELRPLPSHWQERYIEPSALGWKAALESPEVARAAMLVVTHLGRDNGAGLLAASRGQWVFAAVDTPLIGLDAAYALHALGLENETLLQRIRAIWSQFLVEKLCPACAKPARLSPAERDYLFPTEPLLQDPKIEVGCPACNGRGTMDRDAVCEVLLVDDTTRPAVERALLEGTAVRLAPESHVTAQDSARQLVAQGVVGVGTYRTEIRRNPLLRAQNMVEREQSRAFRLDLASRHKSEFLANMSHELRTPLNAVIGFSEVLQSGMAGPLTDQQKDFVNDIRESGRHLLSLINDILDLSKIEAGKMELDVAKFDLPMAIGNAMTLVKGRADRHGIRLESRIDPAVGEYEGDERKVKQVVLNLLTNAIKFTPEGGAVTLSASPANGGYVIAVKDTGIGIAEEDQERIFEEFQQVGNDAARKAEGTGLGLTLTRRLVELHGGTIRVSSAPGQGSTFTFTLPPRAARA